jgi:SNF2 family DNA or RNA helicase
MIFLNGSLPASVTNFDIKVLRESSPEDILGATSFAGVHLATYRRELGNLKVEPACSYISALLSETDEVLLVFAIHKEVIKKLSERLARFKPFVVTGETPMTKRHEAVKAFQSGQSKLFIGNIQALGVGFTLTRANRVVFVEYSWVPGDNDQASDRAHRIGQHDHVFVQYLIYKNSLDRAILETLLSKKKVVKTFNNFCEVKNESDFRV